MEGHHICKEILFEVSGNAVDIARAHEIDLRSAFNSVDFKGGEIVRGNQGEGVVRGIRWTREGRGNGGYCWREGEI